MRNAHLGACELVVTDEEEEEELHILVVGFYHSIRSSVRVQDFLQKQLSLYIY